ncbi:unnamed protein product, partial [Didymodactylos carnosus]
LWIELRQIAEDRFAGPIINVMLQQNIGSYLGLPSVSSQLFELENRWLRMRNHHPNALTVLATLFDNLTELDIFGKRMRFSNQYKRSGQFLIMYRNKIHPIFDSDDCLKPYKDLCVDLSDIDDSSIKERIIELLKYQGYIYLIDEMKQWQMPIFPITSVVLQRNGLTRRCKFNMIINQLKKIWKESNYLKTEDNLINEGFQQGLLYL